MEPYDSTEKYNLKPCPLCGNKNIYAGVASSQSMGVQCHNEDCRCRVDLWIPDKWPKGLRKKGLSIQEMLAKLEEWTLKKAIRAWNTRI